MPTASADGRDEAAPESATTPANTGAQHALLAPEKTPKLYTDAMPLLPPFREGMGNIIFQPDSVAAPTANIRRPTTVNIQM